MRRYRDSLYPPPARRWWTKWVVAVAVLIIKMSHSLSNIKVRAKVISFQDLLILGWIEIAVKNIEDKKSDNFSLVCIFFVNFWWLTFGTSFDYFVLKKPCCAGEIQLCYLLLLEAVKLVTLSNDAIITSLCLYTSMLRVHVKILTTINFFFRLKGVDYWNQTIQDEKNQRVNKHNGWEHLSST